MCAVTVPLLQTEDLLLYQEHSVIQISHGHIVIGAVGPLYVSLSLIKEKTQTEQRNSVSLDKTEIL